MQLILVMNPIDSFGKSHCFFWEGLPYPIQWLRKHAIDFRQGVFLASSQVIK